MEARFSLSSWMASGQMPSRRSRFSLDGRDVQRKRCGDPLFGDPLPDGLQNHKVLLDCGERVDLVVVGERFVICRHEAVDLLLPHLLQDVQTDVPVQQDVLRVAVDLGVDDQRLDDPDPPTDAAMRRFLGLGYAA